jgi:hypothetical protein
MIGADGLLHLLKAEPTLMPPVPTPSGAAIEHRRLDEVHPCLRCGERAACAYIAETELGHRWLDLCWPCSHWVLTTASR